LKKVKQGDEEVDVPTLGYEFDTFITETSVMARSLRKAKHSAQLDAISRVASSEAMTPEMLGVLMGATI
jgi:hypothetical protein